MRDSKKLLALALAAAMTFGMATTAFADADSDKADIGETTPISDTENTPAEGEDEKNADDAGEAGDEKNEDGDETGDEKNEDGAENGDEKNEDSGETEDEKNEDSGENEDGGDAAPALGYTDVTDQNWYYGAVAFVTEQNLMDGVTETSFAPSESMTRQMLAVALYRLAGSPEVTAENPFTDVPDGAAYKDAVVWAYSAGVVTGMTETTFGPDSTLERQAIAAMLARYLKADTTDEVDLSAFTDASEIREYAKGALSWAVTNELVQGNPDGTVDPRGEATRAQVATILQRFAALAGDNAPNAGGNASDGDAAPADDTAPADDAAGADAPADDAADDTGDAADDTGDTGDAADGSAENE